MILSENQCPPIGSRPEGMLYGIMPRAIRDRAVRAAAFGVIHSAGGCERMIVFKTLAAR